MVEDINKPLNKGLVLKIKDHEEKRTFKTMTVSPIVLCEVLHASEFAEESGVSEADVVAIRRNQYTVIDEKEKVVYADYTNLLWKE